MDSSPQISTQIYATDKAPKGFVPRVLVLNGSVKKQRVLFSTFWFLNGFIKNRAVLSRLCRLFKVARRTERLAVPSLLFQGKAELASV
jgi:hypothetical protein